MFNKELTLAVLMMLVLNAVPSSLARKAVSSDSPLTEDAQAQLGKAAHFFKSGHPDRANPIIISVLQGATDLPKCMAIAQYTEGYGFPLMDARKQCLAKALTFCTTRQDFLQVALKSRQYQCFEVTRDAVNDLVASATTPEDLMDLARKAQEMALNDVAHLAMAKVYSQTKTLPDAIAFARQAHLLGMEDLERKAVKDMIDDEPNAHELIALLRNIEPLGLKDMNRYCLKKALDAAANTSEMMDVYNAAKRAGETDIVNVALFRGRRGRIMEQAKAQQDEQSAAAAAQAATQPQSTQGGGSQAGF